MLLSRPQTDDPNEKTKYEALTGELVVSLRWARVAPAGEEVAGEACPSQLGEKVKHPTLGMEASLFFSNSNRTEPNQSF